MQKNSMYRVWNEFILSSKWPCLAVDKELIDLKIPILLRGYKYSLNHLGHMSFLARQRTIACAYFIILKDISFYKGHVSILLI